MCPTLELCEYFLPAAMTVAAFIFVFITCAKVISMFSFCQFVLLQDNSKNFDKIFYWRSGISH